MRTVLLDGDMVAWRVSATAEHTIDWNDGDGPMVVSSEPIADQVQRIKNHIAKYERLTKSDTTIICLSDPDRRYFRNDVFPAYKQHRVSKPAPVQLKELKALLASEYKGKIKPGLEADDVMGILATHPKLVPGEKVIVSVDKDMRQIPGLYFNPDKGGVRVITEPEADLWFYTQVLTGDTCDGFPGCPGIGPVKAAQALGKALEEWAMDAGSTLYRLSESQAMWQAIVKLYEAKGLTEADALVQAQVARILRSSDYDFKESKVKLWQSTH